MKPLKELIKEFLHEKRRKDLSEVTIKNYEWHLNSFKQFMENKPLTTENIRNFLDQSFDKKSLQRQQVIILKSLFKHGGIRLMDKIETPRRRERPVRPVSLEKIRELLEAGTIFDKALVSFFISGGYRIQKELLQILIKDVDFDKRVVRIWSKGKKRESGEMPDLAPFSAEAKDYLLEYLGDRISKKDDWLFVDGKGEKWSYHRLKYYFEKHYGVNPHRLRHTFAMEGFKRGISAPEMKVLMRLKEYRTLMRYSNEETEKILRSYYRRGVDSNSRYRREDDSGG